jgi:hypothetical protein
MLFKVYPPGLDNEYSTSRGLYSYLAHACDSKPGIALAYSDDGHWIRYHTDCSVIANNFLLTPIHAEKTAQLQGLLRLSPEELMDAVPNIDYAFARLYNAMRLGAGGFEATPKEIVVESSDPLMVALTMRSYLPENYEVVAEISLDESAECPFARVLRVQHRIVQQIKDFLITSTFPLGLLLVYGKPCMRHVAPVLNYVQCAYDEFQSARY